MKEEVGGLVVGGFEPEAKPWVSPDQIPYPFEFQLLDEDWEHFSFLLESAVHRVPVLEQTGLKKLYNGPESFTPDNQFLLGEAPELAGFFVGCRVQLGGHRLGRWRRTRSGASGSSRASRRPTWWRSTSDGSRLGVATRSGCVTGSSKCSGCTTRCHGRTASSTSARPFRRSPVHQLLDDAGRTVRLEDGLGARQRVRTRRRRTADFGYTWEQAGVAGVVVRRAARDARAASRSSTRPHSASSRCRGRDAEALMQRVCSANVAVEPGRDRLHGDAQQPWWLRGRRHGDSDRRRPVPGRDRVGVHRARHRLGVASHRCPASASSWSTSPRALPCSASMGPRSRDLLQPLTAADLSDEAFPFSTSQLVDVSGATVRATRITYVGELGWELYVPVEHAVDVYRGLVRSGGDALARPATTRSTHCDSTWAIALSAATSPRLHARRGGAHVHLRSQ